jgi:hypothetical protein
MKKEKTRRALRTFFRWLGWVVVIQFILFNLSAALYAYKFTRLYRQEQKETELKTNETNLFSKTIRLFSGYRFYKSAVLGEPTFSFTSIYLETKEKIPVEAWYGRPDSSKARLTINLYISGAYQWARLK